MLSVIMLSVIMLRVIMVNVTYKPFVLNVIMLSVIRLNVVMLSVMAPNDEHIFDVTFHFWMILWGEGKTMYTFSVSVNAFPLNFH
jgi:hypothetical protein